MERIKPMKQGRQHRKNLLWKFIQLSVPMPRDAKVKIYLSIPIDSPRSDSWSFKATLRKFEEISSDCDDGEYEVISASFKSLLTENLIS